MPQMFMDYPWLCVVTNEPSTSMGSTGKADVVHLGNTRRCIIEQSKIPSRQLEIVACQISSWRHALRPQQVTISPLPLSRHISAGMDIFIASGVVVSHGTEHIDQQLRRDGHRSDSIVASSF